MSNKATGGFQKKNQLGKPLGRPPKGTVPGIDKVDIARVYEYLYDLDVAVEIVGCEASTEIGSSRIQATKNTDTTC